MKKIFTLLIVALCLYATPGKALTADDLTGVYNEHVYGTQWWDSYETYDWEEFDYNNTIKITKIDENTVNFYNIFGWGSNLVGNVNWEDGTITIEPQNMNEWYVFCQYSWYEEGEDYVYPGDIPVIATFNEDGSIIKLNNYTLNYQGDGWSYSYVYITESVLTRHTPLYTIKGNAYYEAWIGEPLYEGEATLTAYESFYTLENYAGEGTLLQFTVNEESEEIAEIQNGYIDDSGNGYWIYYIKGEEDNMYLDIADGLSYFRGNQEKGELSFDYYYYDNFESMDYSSYGTFFFTWEGAGIQSPANAVQNNADQPIYNLYGIRVADSAAELNNLPKGIYIVNGKKCCVK